VSALQEEFAQSAARLIQYAAEMGYGVTLGEAWRTPEQAAVDADKGIGVMHSLHTERLAIDLNLFIDGVYEADDASGAYRILGIWWKNLGPNYRWGGDFKLVDLDHYSLSPDGVRG
jgi:hypothetical protein